MKISEKLFTIIDNTRKNSNTNKLRKKRFKFFKSIFKNLLKEDVRILDVGGTVNYWENMGLIRENIEIVLLNKLKIENTNYPTIRSITGDATNMSMFEDKSFDIIHSNSVIEHVGPLKQQRKMADEIMRIGKNYFVQTPNYYFPVEPHFLFVGFQWLPIKTRAFLLRNFRLTLGRRKKIKNYSKSLEVADSIRLLKKKEFRSLFPGAKIYIEEFFGLEKSFVVYKYPQKKINIL